MPLGKYCYRPGLGFVRSPSLFMDKISQAIKAQRENLAQAQSATPINEGPDAEGFQFLEKVMYGGTRSERRIGYLLQDGKSYEDIVVANDGDIFDTPIGSFQFTDYYGWKRIEMSETDPNQTIAAVASSETTSTPTWEAVAAAVVNTAGDGWAFTTEMAGSRTDPVYIGRLTKNGTPYEQVSGCEAGTVVNTPIGVFRYEGLFNGWVRAKETAVTAAQEPPEAETPNGGAAWVEVSQEDAEVIEAAQTKKPGIMRKLALPAAIVGGGLWALLNR